MISDIWSCPVVSRSSLAQKFNFATVFCEKVLFESSLILSINIGIIVLPDGQSLSSNISIWLMEDNSFDSERSCAYDTIVNLHVHFAFRPIIVFPVCAYIGIPSFSRQGSIQIMENAFEWPSPFDSLINVGKLQI
jgi:hypothetical protein